MLSVRGRLIGAEVDSASDVPALGAESIKAAPQMNASVDAGRITGKGCVNNGDGWRMPILTDIDALTSSAQMGWTEVSRQCAAEVLARPLTSALSCCPCPSPRVNVGFGTMKLTGRVSLVGRYPGCPY